MFIESFIFLSVCLFLSLLQASGQSLALKNQFEYPPSQTFGEYAALVCILSVAMWGKIPTATLIAYSLLSVPLWWFTYALSVRIMGGEEAKGYIGNWADRMLAKLRLRTGTPPDIIRFLFLAFCGAGAWFWLA